MFNLSRYFLTVSFILIVLAAGVFGPLYRQLAERQIGSLAENRNVALARLIESTLQPPPAQLLAASPGLEARFLRRLAEAQGLQEQIAALTQNTAVLEVRIYNRLGVAVFASDPAHIGENRPDDAAFRAALAGGVSSRLTRRGAGHELTSLAPVLGANGAADGVFELRRDVTPFMQQVQRGQWGVSAGAFAIFALLFMMQYAVVRRAQRMLTAQDEHIKTARDTLELQVEARTQELKRINARLQDEIAERRQAESQLNHLAYHDPLTGLANRRCFIERLEKSLGESAQSGRQLAVLFIDLDQFKQINDSFGHGVGDELLVAVAARLTERMRLVDMLARLGGDEFVCLMERLPGEDDAAAAAGEIIDAIEPVFRLGGHELFLSASVGISLFPRDGASVLELLRNADTAMYRAKASGRGQFHFYTPEMTRHAQQRMRMENLLRRALEQQEFAVCLQAQVDTRNGALVGAEALVRWHSPELGMVMPSLFIPLAEESGLIVPLGAWVLRETCRQVRRWQESGFTLPTASVNVSVRQLERPEFAGMLRAILEETGMDPARLKLELTESVLMGVGDASGELRRLRELGVGLAIDDFGTGYSSLSYLKRLPVQQLKIDRSFVVGIGHNPGDEAIIRTIMQLATSLEFEVVAEGVETAEQAAFLAALGCQRLQGKLHGEALAPDEFRSRWG